MSELVIMDDDGVPTTTSVRIANGTGVEHASVLRLIRTNLEDFEEFGTLRFEIAKSGGRPTEYAILNEEQATLLMTYMRNSEVVRDFKKRLVREFSALRKAKTAVALPSRKELARMVWEAEEALEATEAARIAAEEYAQLMQGPAESWLNLAEAKGDYSVNDASHMLNADPSISTGETRLRSFMLNEGWIRYVGRGRDRHPAPYQTQVNAGRLFERPGHVYWDDTLQRNMQGNPQIRVTMKGISKLHQLLGGSEPVQFMAIVQDSDDETGS